MVVEDMVVLEFVSVDVVDIVDVVRLVIVVVHTSQRDGHL